MLSRTTSAARMKCVYMFVGIGALDVNTPLPPYRHGRRPFIALSYSTMWGGHVWLDQMKGGHNISYITVERGPIVGTSVLGLFDMLAGSSALFVPPGFNIA